MKAAALAEKIAVRARARQFEDKHVFVDVVDEQPVGLDVALAKRIALTLHMCDMIDEEHLSGRKAVFSLKTPHNEPLHAAEVPQKRRNCAADKSDPMRRLRGAIAALKRRLRGVSRSLPVEGEL